MHHWSRASSISSRLTSCTYDDAMAISAHPKELDRLLSHRGAMLSTA